jgi:hypothetical protein
VFRVNRPAARFRKSKEGAQARLPMLLLFA